MSRHLAGFRCRLSRGAWLFPSCCGSFSLFGCGFSRRWQFHLRLFRSTMVAMVQRLDARSFFFHPQLRVACRSEFVTADAAGGVRVLPLDGSSIGGVGVDVAAEFASQVGNRGEDAARDDLAFDLGEPDLDLVEPGRASGREVKPDSRMLLEELADRLSFVRGKIVEDDVNLLPRRAQGYDLLQKGDELTAGMAGSGFAGRYQRLFCRPPPPPPPRYPPPLPPRSSFGRASLTFSALPSSSLPFRPAMAASASVATLISTNPKPLARPVSRSVTTLTRSTVPYSSNIDRTASSVAPKQVGRASFR